MNKAGFNNTAFSIGIRLLKAKGFITTKVDSDFNGNEYTVCSLSNTGGHCPKFCVNGNRIQL